MPLSKIITQLKEVFEGDPWYGQSISSALQTIETKQLSLNLNGGHTIGQILEHMIAWRQFAIDSLKGRTPNIVPDSEEDWGTTPCDKKPILQSFRTTQNELIFLLSNKSDDLLNEIVPGKNYTLETMLNGIIQHDIYHLGQVLLIKSSQTAP